ncbi:MAG: exo-alpha-sialidase [Saprospiraceae bacterium]|nr:exo-alpha-sialidase [Saprospiraceae bacterium]
MEITMYEFQSGYQGFLKAAICFCLPLTGFTQPAATVQSEIYYPTAGLDTAQWISMSYLDGNLTRQEIHNTSSASDAYVNFQKRISSDNGKTWSAFIPLAQVTLQLAEGGMVKYPGHYTYDPTLKILYQSVMRRHFPGKRLYDYSEHDYIDHCIISENGQEKELKYEDGPDFNKNDPFYSTYLRTNRAYMGQKVTVAQDGTAYYPMICYRQEHENGINQGGVVLMIRDRHTGVWSASNQIYISPNISSRGLLEPEVAILKNGNLLIVCRGSNAKDLSHTIFPDSLQARKWYSISTDSGKTLSSVKEFTYEDGTSFYSPSSIHSFMRSSKNGKLYWLANIVPEEPIGNSPRHPLFLVEIDEDLPAVRKDHHILVDDRRPNEPDGVQLSNFSLIENRETLDFEIYLTKIGQVPNHLWHGNVYKYSIKLTQP